MRSRHALILAFAACSLVLVGADKPSCSSIEPEEPVCAADLDCQGLPHPWCPGEYRCVQGLCEWDCQTCPGSYQCAEDECKWVCLTQEGKLGWPCWGSSCEAGFECDEGHSPPVCTWGYGKVGDECYPCDSLFYKDGATKEDCNIFLCGNPKVTCDPDK